MLFDASALLDYLLRVMSLGIVLVLGQAVSFADGFWAVLKKPTTKRASAFIISLLAIIPNPNPKTR